jgi:hypothetical protein
MHENKTPQPVTRRQALGLAAGAAGALLAAPMLNIGRFRLYATSTVEYSARCLKLMQESTVLDLLGPLTISGKWQEWARDPELFTDADAQRFHGSGINVFHHAFGLGARTRTTLPSTTSRWSMD